MRTGIERIVTSSVGLRRGDRVALVANQASVLPDLTHAAVALATQPGGARLTRILAPEHGLWGEAQDLIPVDDERDPRTGVPVMSLYGRDERSLHPTAAHLADVDVVVFDLQDVGARFYTFLATLRYLLEAAREHDVRVVVADRPNPIGGVAVEGPLVEPAYESFVGAFPVPIRHGMTAGEIAAYLNQELAIHAPLEVVELEGWARSRPYCDTGLPWVAPSPNMPTVDTALVYPGLCLLEGTNASEGRGTTRPFEVIGAPWVDPFALADALAAAALEDVRFRPLHFRPTFQKWAGVRCGGVQLHVTGPRFRPLRAGLEVLRELRRQGGADFAWRTETYEFVSDRLAIDLLLGSRALREALEAGARVSEPEACWRPALDGFLEVRARYLRYGAGSNPRAWTS